MNHYHFTVADDDLDMLALVEEILVGSFPNCEVATFADATEALHHVEDGGTDLLITNHNMVQMSGPELIRKTRLEEIGIPIVMISSDPNVGEEGMRAGATSFLDKRHLVSRLPTLVERLVATRQ